MLDMKKAKKLVVGNWKMNPMTLDEAKKIVTGVRKVVKGVKKTEVVICPPYLYIQPLSSLAKDGLHLGAQNANSNTTGPLTGEVSHMQLPQFNVRYVIVGHSERRKMGETDEKLNRKVLSIVGIGMTAIVCIGEETRDSNGDYLEFIKQQILKALNGIAKKSLDNIIIAYEPVWAVGGKEAMTPIDLHEMSIYIKKVLKDTFSIAGDGVRVIYGGAVDKFNAQSLMKDGNVSGFLVGRQSLDAGSFSEIIKAVDTQ